MTVPARMKFGVFMAPFHIPEMKLGACGVPLNCQSPQLEPGTVGAVVQLGLHASAPFWFRSVR